MCGGWLPLCHGSRLVRALRAIEAVGQTSAIPPALALPRPVAALPYVLPLAPTAESFPAPENFFQKRLRGRIGGATLRSANRAARRRTRPHRALQCPMPLLRPN